MVASLVSVALAAAREVSETSKKLHYSRAAEVRVAFIPLRRMILLKVTLLDRSL